jgi:hypothetical protein
MTIDFRIHPISTSVNLKCLNNWEATSILIFIFLIKTMLDLIVEESKEVLAALTISVQNPLNKVSLSLYDDNLSHERLKLLSHDQILSIMAL